MSDELLMQLSSNSNPTDPSLPTKLAKLEARMAGKGSSSAPVSVVPPVKLMASEELQDSPYSSDSDENVGGEYLIQANFHKRQKICEDEQATTTQDSEEADERIKLVEVADSRTAQDELNRKRQGRGKCCKVTGKACGSRASDQLRSTTLSMDGHLDNSIHKELWAKEKFENSERAALQEHIAILSEKLTLLEEELCKSHHEASDYQQLCHKLEKEDLALSSKKVTLLEQELCKSRQEASDYQQLCHKLEKELNDHKEHDQHMKTKRLKVLSDLLISVSKAEREEARMKIRQESLRLGNVGVIRAGTIISETWEDGQALKDITAHLKSILETKESIERQRKSLKKRQSDKGESIDTENGMSEEDYLRQDEIFKSRLSSIKREEEATLRERDRYELEKARLIREMKRVRDEDGSRFNNFQILNHRYALLNLLGKGGFSEVYKAYDLLENRYVACKLHGLNAQWNDEKKKSYIRHAIREYDIHKMLVHAHIVRLWDIFEIDQNTFCTVLEYCSGRDLDIVLKATPILPEREARIIIVQIFQALVYLNKRQQKIIHYDLKPGNVIFDEVGVAKITDFGLSKIMSDDVGSGMELTSQGAGTYWYLPPECFDLNKTPLISSKVDVWSAGVIFYQMLFGKRPFGHDQSQERILRENTIINARKVEFPSKPSASNEAKDLIRRCLTYNQAERPDVMTIAQDLYLSYVKR